MTRIVVHGGAGSVSDEIRSRRKPVLNRAAKEGFDVLKEERSAGEAVLRAVTVLEDNPLFNAGIGSVLTMDGRVEMDASFMSSRGQLGAVSELTRVRHPIRVAKLVCDETDHCFLTGQGLESFVKAHDVPRVDPVTERQREKWEALKTKLREAGHDVDRIPDPEVWGHCTSIVRSVRDRDPDANGTVGAVALDQQGVTAAATSTGGRSFKLPGRVGDSPLPGAGTIANGTGAASATGDGEGIMQIGIAHVAAERMTSMDAQEAAERTIEVADRRNVDCGVVTIRSETGNSGAAHNTDSMDTVALP